MRDSATCCAQVANLATCCGQVADMQPAVGRLLICNLLFTACYFATCCPFQRRVQGYVFYYVFIGGRSPPYTNIVRYISLYSSLEWTAGCKITGCEKAGCISATCKTAGCISATCPQQVAKFATCAQQVAESRVSLIKA